MRPQRTLDYALTHGGQRVSYEDWANDLLPPPIPQRILPTTDPKSAFEAVQQGYTAQVRGNQTYLFKGPFHCWLDIGPPASVAILESWEAEHGIRLPAALRKVLREFAQELHFGCFIASQVGGPWRRAQLDWSLSALEASSAASLEEVIFLEDADCPRSKEVARVFRAGHTKLFFQNLSNGDSLLMDVQSDAQSPVICADHEQYELPLFVASDFINFLDRITLVGCLSDDHSCFQELCQSDGLDTRCPKALQIRSQLDLDN